MARSFSLARALFLSPILLLAVSRTGRPLLRAPLVARAPAAMSSAASAAAARALVARIQDDPQDGKQWMKLANMARDARDLRMAERVLLAGVRALPQNALLWHALATTLHDAGRYAPARSVYRKALELNSSLGSVYHSWGRMEAALGNIETARELYERGIARSLPRPNSRLLHALAVLLDGTLSQTAEARAMLRDALAHDPRNAQLLHALGLLEANCGNTAPARGYLQAAVAVTCPRILPPAMPVSALALGLLAGPAPPGPEAAAAQQQPYWQAAHALARLEDAAGNAALARDLCVRAIDGTAGAVQIWQFWAHLEENAQLVAAARRVYRMATAQHPRDHALWVQWARMEDRVGDTRAAAGLYERAIAADPTNADCYSRYAKALLREGGGAELSAFSAARPLGHLERAERDAALEGARGMYRAGAKACGGSGRATLATADARRLSRLLNDWAVLEWKQGDLVQARVLFARSLSLAPREQLAWVLQLYARFEADCGNAVLARHLLARAVNSDRFDGSTWRFWADLEERAGERALASRLLSHAAAQDATRTLMYRRSK